MTGYLAISVGVYLFQEELIFQPKKLERNYTFHFNQPSQEYFIPTKDGETLNALFFPSPTSSKGFILYFHGNAGNLQRWGEYAVDFTRLGYDILMIDYRGYGKSTGSPDELKLYEDAVTVLQDFIAATLRNQYCFHLMVLVGIAVFEIRVRVSSYCRR